MSSPEARLYAIIDRRFDLTELRELCTESNIDFENLFDDGSRESKIGAIIQAAKRKDKIGDLTRSIHNLRPNLPDTLVIEFEYYFQNPTMNTTDVMKPPSSNNGVLISGDACKNIGIALEKLGIGTHKGDKYDQLLSDLVSKFQEDYDHPEPDGFFGPGTRHMLMKALLEEKHGIYNLKDLKSPSYPPEFLKALPSILENNFSPGELKNLCFELDVNYDSLPGNGTAERSLEIVEYLERRGRQNELIEKVIELRPNSDWPIIS